MLSKKYVLILILQIVVTVFGADYLTAQEQFAVQNFFEATNDLTPRNPKYAKKDRNGNQCAIIKVVTTDDDFIFGFGVLGFTDRLRVGGEIWIYVSPGTKKISISHRKYGKIEYHFKEPLKAQTTYILKLILPPYKPDDTSIFVPDPNGEKKKVTMHFFPPESQVMINGMSVSPDADGIISQELVHGNHDLYVSSLHYHSIRQAVKVDDSSKDSLFFQLSPAYGWLVFGNVEGDETILIDGNRRPMPLGKELKLDSGHYQIGIDKPFYLSYSTDVEIKDTVRLPVFPVFVPNYRELEFSVESNAEIRLDGEKKGVGHWKGKVLNGEHTVECVLASHRTSVRTISVDSRTPDAIKLEMPSPIYGTLSIDSYPYGADVVIDGEIIGKTPVPPYKILIGTHQVTLRKENYKSVTRKIETVENQRISLDEKLENIFLVTINTKPGDASVSVDGKMVDDHQTRLLAGRHTVSLTAYRHLDMSRRIYVDESNTVFNFKMRRRYYYPTSFGFGVYGSTSPSNTSDMSDMSDMWIGGYISINANKFSMDFTGMYGLNSSEKIYWNSLGFSQVPGSAKYVPITAGGSLGYGFILGTRIRLIPQLGGNWIMLKAKDVDGSYPSEVKPQAVNICGDLKFCLALSRVWELTVVPEYDIPVYKSDTYSAIYDISPIVRTWTEGFRLKVGLGLYF